MISSIGRSSSDSPIAEFNKSCKTDLNAQVKEYNSDLVLSMSIIRHDCLFQKHFETKGCLIG